MNCPIKRTLKRKEEKPVEPIYSDKYIPHIPKIELINGGIILDGVRLESVLAFEITKSSADAPTELSVKMLVTC